MCSREELRSMSRLPVAFMSYANVDNVDGRLTEFRQRLSDEIRLLRGEPFPIFQDNEGVSWGENWRERIEKSLDAATFLILILTPSFFKSAECRKEFSQFLERERRLGRNDLILPVYYIDCLVLNDEKRRSQDSIAQAIFERQYADWRALRHEPYSSYIVAKKLESLGKQVLLALDRESSPRQSHAAPQNVPQVLVVDPLHRGDCTSISEAHETSRPAQDESYARLALLRQSVSSHKPLSAVLMEALALAHALNHKEFEKWLRLELEGYFPENPIAEVPIAVPPYRIVPVEWLDIGGKPITFEDPEVSESKKYGLRDGVAELERHSRSQRPLTAPWPGLARLLRKTFRVELGCIQFSPASYMGVLDRIKVRFLGWLRTLEMERRSM
jgi:hypothetical protein